MAFAASSPRQDAMAQMNITPLVGVMMALLVIFMVALPVTSRPVPLDIGFGCNLGAAASESVHVHIDAAGGVFVNDQPTPMSALHAVFATAQADATPQSASLLMDIDGEADYQTVARVIAAGRDAGLVSVDFVKY